MNDPRDEPTADDLAVLDALDQYWDGLAAGSTAPPAAWFRERVLPPECLPLLALLARFEEARLTLSEDSLGAPSTEDGATPPLPTDAGESLPPGTALGEFEVLGRLGGGGMGVVYRAFHTRLKKPAALKVITPHLLGEPSAAARFDREMEAVARLDHPNVVRVMHAGEAGGSRYLAMELLDGQDLAALVRRRGPLPIPDAAELARQAALGLAHAHERGVVHRDVKPSNLMCTPDGTVKILDLGLARLQADGEGRAGITEAWQVLGTPDYLAPEQFAGGDAPDGRADLYGLGATLFFLLTGRPPFADVDGSYEKMKAHESEPAPDVRSLRPEVPRALGRLVTRLLAKRRHERPATAAEVAAALELFAAGSDLRLLLGQQGESPTPALLGRPARRRPWGRRALLAAGVCLVAALAAGAALIASRHRPEPQTAAPPPQPLRIVKFEVRYYEGRTERQLGVLRQGWARLPRVEPHNSVRVEARTSEPAYCYLIAFDPNGKWQGCHPPSEDRPPEATDRIRHPANEGVCFDLEEDCGLQAFALLVSRRPLPALAAWRARSGLPWQKAQGEGFVGGFTPEGGYWGGPRGRLVERDLRTPAALRKLCEALNDADLDTFEVLAFPVEPAR